MKISRQSPFSGKIHTLEIPCTKEEYERWSTGTPIQYAMPNVPSELREFVITGITPEEWNETFGDDHV